MSGRQSDYNKDVQVKSSASERINVQVDESRKLVAQTAKQLEQAETAVAQELAFDIETTMRYCRLIPPENLVTPLDRMGIPPEAEAPRPAPDPTHDLFDAPLEPGPLLALDTWSDRARALYAALKTRLLPAHPAIRCKPG